MCESRICKRCEVDQPMDQYYNYYVVDKKTKVKYYHKRLQCKRCYSNKTHAIRYKITVEEVEKLKAQTNCEICKKFIPSEGNRYIDHNHLTGKVRGMLCPRCNGVLQIFEDDMSAIYNYNKYLKKYNDKKNNRV
tara:strand:- start:21 stop:422 length:402 start_codon:yes stop_codon:yes gene_type:complete